MEPVNYSGRNKMPTNSPWWNDRANAMQMAEHLVSLAFQRRVDWCIVCHDQRAGAVPRYAWTLPEWQPDANSRHMHASLPFRIRICLSTDINKIGPKRLDNHTATTQYTANSIDWTLDKTWWLTLILILLLKFIITRINIKMSTQNVEDVPTKRATRY